KFGDYKNFTSLDVLATLFDIPSPKEDISGADIYRVYYQNQDLERIKTYCQHDVATLVQVYLRFVGESKLDSHQVVYR
ncbi:MAG: 3'-5' exonuclease, partial [Bacteroidota bacterium]|nr:3'-5' exonuclease [Bacteroidota bacterium]